MTFLNRWTNGLVRQVLGWRDFSYRLVESSQEKRHIFGDGFSQESVEQETGCHKQTGVIQGANGSWSEIQWSFLGNYLNSAAHLVGSLFLLQRLWFKFVAFVFSYLELDPKTVHLPTSLAHVDSIAVTVCLWCGQTYGPTLLEHYEIGRTLDSRS